MASGIEHRTIDSVLQSYQDSGLTNFSIWNGKRLCVKYDGGNVDEALNTLIAYLNQIATSGTMSVYMLKVHADDTKSTAINNGSVYEGSTTFMLSPVAVTTTTPTGVTIIDPASKTAGYGQKDLITRLEKLEQQNQEYRDLLHKQDLEKIKADFTNQIAGIKKKEDKKHWLDRVMDYVETKPDQVEKILDKTFDSIGRLTSIFREQKNYIVNKPAAGGAVAGTTNKSEQKTDTETMATETDSYELTTEGALINPFLTDDERKLKSGAQSEIIRSKIGSLDQDAHDEIQSECMEIIEKRIGAVTMSLLLLKLASLDNSDLNKVLNNLD